LILNIPTRDDFFNVANNYLNSSWGSVIELLREFEVLGDMIEDSSAHEDERQRYWGAANQTLISATALVQQAVEFYIKGKISDVSPYLLIVGAPQSWPRGCASNNIEFSSFRTLDAQDLIHVHNTVCENKFSDEFIQWFDELRDIRNKVIHTVDKSLKVKPEEALDFILYAHNYFVAEDWFKSRAQYLEQTPANSMKILQGDAFNDSYNLGELLIEFRIITNVLRPAKLKYHLNFNKRVRILHCPSCIQKVSEMDDWDYESASDYGKTYQLIQRTGSFICCLCGYASSTVNKKCNELGCKGEYLDTNSGVCFTCFNTNAPQLK
jgi:hypothetical protein